MTTRISIPPAKLVPQGTDNTMVRPASRPWDRDWNPAAHDAVLAWCQATHYSDPVKRPCMRRAQDGACIIVDVNRVKFDRLATGGDWLEVATELGIEVNP